MPFKRCVNVTGMFEIMQGWDLALLNGLRSLHSPWLVWSAFGLASLAWKGSLMWCLAVLFWLTHRRRLAVQLAGALVIAVIFVGALKGVVQRPRPDLYVSQHLNIPMPELLTTAHSFPSGHETLASAGAFVLTTGCGGWMAFAAWLFVGLVGVARVYQGLHWPSDMFGSIGLGIAAGALALWVSRFRMVNTLLRTGDGKKS